MSAIGDAEAIAPPHAQPRGRIAMLGALAVRLGAAGLAYLLQIVLARSLGATEYGIFSFAWSLVTIGGFLATCGYAQIAVRFLAQYQQAGDAAHAHGFIRRSLLVTTLGAGLAVLGLLAFFPIIEWGFGSLCCAALLIGLIALPFFALTDLVEGYARSQGWTIRALTPPYLLRGGGLMIMLVIAVGAGQTVSAVFAMKLALVATIFACLVQITLTIPPLLRVLPPASPASDARLWHDAAMPTLLSDVALLARQNIDLIVLGMVATPAAVGLYFAATRIASLLGLIDFALGAAFGHRFARAMQGDGTPRLAVVWREAWWLAVGLGIGTASILLLLAPVILSLFGPDFVSATAALHILLAAGAFRLMIGPAEDLLTMGGHAGDVWRANGAGAFVMALGCVAFAPTLHATGAAIGAALGTLVATALLRRAVRTRLDLPLLAWRKQS